MKEKRLFHTFPKARHRLANPADNFIDAATVDAYLALANVICVGGSWFLPQDLLRRGAWGDIERAAQRLRPSASPANG